MQPYRPVSEEIRRKSACAIQRKIHIIRCNGILGGLAIIPAQNPVMMSFGIKVMKFSPVAVHIITDILCIFLPWSKTNEQD